jgi:enoyl-CoA hydratase
MSEPEVLISREGAAARITLNRPKALHALTHGMCGAMIEALLVWRSDPSVQIVLIDHSGERGFCAGGDIRAMARNGYAQDGSAAAFFRTEYQLNHLLFTYPKPTAAFIDGVVMGGGVGISLPCRYRVATERTTFAMPETGIGLFPDVGGGWYLPRLPHRAGWWLGITGARIKAADCRLLGLATHYATSDSLGGMKAALVADPAAAERILAERSIDSGPAPLQPHLAALAEAFARPSLDEAIASLKAGDDWSRAQAEVIVGKSPQSLRVTWRLLTAGAAAERFASHMALEFRLAPRIVATHDFQQGVRAVVLAKDNDPRWYPPSLDDLTDEDVRRFFEPLSPEDEWTPLPQLEDA